MLQPAVAWDATDVLVFGTRAWLVWCFWKSRFLFLNSNNCQQCDLFFVYSLSQSFGFAETGPGLNSHSAVLIVIISRHTRDAERSILLSVPVLHCSTTALAAWVLSNYQNIWLGMPKSSRTIMLEKVWTCGIWKIQEKKIGSVIWKVAIAEALNVAITKGPTALIGSERQTWTQGIIFISTLLIFCLTGPGSGSEDPYPPVDDPAPSKGAKARQIYSIIRRRKLIKIDLCWEESSHCSSGREALALSLRSQMSENWKSVIDFP